MRRHHLPRHQSLMGSCNGRVYVGFVGILKKLSSTVCETPTISNMSSCSLYCLYCSSRVVFCLSPIFHLILWKQQIGQQSSVHDFSSLMVINSKQHHNKAHSFATPLVAFFLPSSALNTISLVKIGHWVSSNK